MVERNDHVIHTAGLTKVFKDFWLRDKVTAVANLTLEIFPREVFGLLGPNGSGKSTTLKMILGLLYPTRGRITVLGCRPTDVKVKARIGFLPEESYLYPFLDAWETLDFYGRLFHQPRRERRRRIEMLLDMVGLTAVAYRRIGEYSKGMQRRIGLAQALINDPDLLIVDEPTSGMDPIGTKQFKDLIRTLAGRGKTVLLSSHLLGDVEDICDRVCILYGGHQRATGDMTDLLAQHDLTQITTDHLSETTLREVRQVVASAGKNVLEVSAPRDKLESLFVRIVAEARREQLDTGGAVDTGRVAQFLRAEPPATGERVIEDLVAAARPEESAPSEEAPQPTAPAADEPARDVLAGLVSAARPAEATSEPAGEDDASDQSRTPAPPPAARADQSVLDSLLGSPPAESPGADDPSEDA